MRRAACAERGSEHPVGAAICAHAKAHNVATVEPSNFQSRPGGGLSCEVDGEPLLVGNRAWLADHGVTLAAEQEQHVSMLERKGCTVALVAVQNR